MIWSQEPKNGRDRTHKEYMSLSHTTTQGTGSELDASFTEITPIPLSQLSVASGGGGGGGQVTQLLPVRLWVLGCQADRSLYLTAKVIEVNQNV